MNFHPGTLRACPAPAKLNLFLHVVGRREDGYHLLQTAFQLIDRCDLLSFSLRDDAAICRTTDVKDVPLDTDLSVRAANLLQNHASDRLGRSLPGVDIALEKRLPLGGGLGGGSSDAATTLIALNFLWGANFTRAELLPLGLQLGADVPFFLSGGNAFAEGVGELLSPIETPDCWYVVIEPAVSVSTASVFAERDLTRDTKPVKITDFSASTSSFGGFGKNDLQTVVSRLYPPVAEALRWLMNYGEARMTGSGACVFCAFHDEVAADAVVKNVPQQWKAWKARTLARHPLDVLLRE